MFEDVKMVSKSRLTFVAGTSITRVNRVIRELKERGLIAPEQSPTGREHLSPREAGIVLRSLGVEGEHAA